MHAKFGKAMKIIYNPFFTERPFLGKQRLFNQVVLNTRGLLAELELRAGLTAVFPSPTERVVAYLAAMQQAIEHKGSCRLFFEKSFELDKFGTAKIILDWRDKLVSAGWSREEGSDKLDGLAAIERYFDTIGESDRWHSVLRYAQRNAVLTPHDSIEVTTSKNHLSATLTQLLEAIEEKGTPVTYQDRVEDTHIARPIHHHHFYTDTEAHTWITQQQLSDNDVIVGFDNAILVDLAVLTNRPSVASNEIGVGQQMQMLSLGIELFKTPIDAQCLLDYLRLPKSPLRFVYVERTALDGHTYLKPLSEALKEILLGGGLGERWKTELDKPIIDYDCQKPLTAPKRKEVMEFINMWEKSFTDDGKCVVHKTDVTAFVAALRKWAAQRQHRQDGFDAQFVALASACDEMLMLLETQPDVIVVDDIILWSRQIVQPAILSEAEATIGSPNAVDSPTDIYANPDKVYWLCSTIAPAEDMYAFLGTKDRTTLEKAGIDVPKKGSNAIFLQKEIFTNLQKAKEIHLVSCDIRHGEAAMLNDVAMQLLNLVSASSTSTVGFDKKAVTGMAKPQEIYKIDPAKIQAEVTAHGGHLREKESYSSLSTLIQSPFEYVLQYILNLQAYQSEALSDINTVKGNVAHAYIEQLTNENDKDADKMLAMHQREYDARIDAIIAARGILLLQENNQLDMMLFKSQLKESVNVLLNILISNGLTIIGSEYWAETNIAGIGQMDAKVDLLLQKEGELYIFDFKWNESSTYTRKLESNLALQLAVYKNILEKAMGQKVVFCGYYILPKHQLLTHNGGFLTDTNIEVVEPANTDDIFQQAIRSYSYRKEQLLNGLIEEAELLPLANLQYVQDALEKELYPLETDYEEHELKGTPYGQLNIVLKGRLQ